MTAPWHLWGSTQNLQLGPQAAGSVNFPIQQLANVEYFRPDTWSFFCGVMISCQAKPAAVGEAISVQMAFQFGVGRSNQRWTRVGNFNWQTAELPGVGQTVQKLATEFEVQPPAVNTLWGTVAVPTFFRQIPAQSIQLSAEVSGALGANNIYLVEVTGYVAPMHHARPEWWMSKIGEELGGR